MSKNPQKNLYYERYQIEDQMSMMEHISLRKKITKDLLIDMSKFYSFVSIFIEQSKHTLDLSIGSSRDLLYFKDKSDYIVGVDSNQELINRAITLDFEAYKMNDFEIPKKINKKFNLVYGTEVFVSKNKNEIKLILKSLSSFLEKSSYIIFIADKNIDFSKITKPYRFLDLEEFNSNLNMVALEKI